jgi:hypothetical protein
MTITNYVLVLKPVPALIGVFTDVKDAENCAGRRGGKVITGEDALHDAAARYGIGPVTPVGDEPPARLPAARQGPPLPAVLRERDRFRKTLAEAGVKPLPFKRPTVEHRPAVWVTLLGAFGAEAPDGTTKFFDYDLQAALKHARLRTAKARAAADLRVGAFRGDDEFLDDAEQPHDGMIALWAVR